jgi:GNAT superfamily N-acetyltransferase
MEIVPLTPARWQDFETLFGQRGACGGCWCMWWRIPHKQFSAQGNAGNKQMMKQIVDSKEVPGLLAYVEEQPAAWVSVGPRQIFVSLEHSRVLARVDDQPVWSINCFFIDKRYRGQGLTLELIEAATAYAQAQGAKIVEAYPMDHTTRQLVYSAYRGHESVFLKAGFIEAARRSAHYPVMRKYL